MGWCWRVEFFVSAGNDGCKNTGRRRWLCWGINLANRLLYGEWTLWEERYFAEVDDNSAGDTYWRVMLKGLMNSTGDRKTSPGTIFPWQLAEDNPVISWWGNNLWIKSGRGFCTLRGISFQNLLGISFQNLPGILIQLSWGKFWTVLGEWLPWGVWYSAGEQSYIKTAGDACLRTSVYSAGGMLRSSGDTQLP